MQCSCKCFFGFWCYLLAASGLGAQPGVEANALWAGLGYSGVAQLGARGLGRQPAATGQLKEVVAMAGLGNRFGPGGFWELAGGMALPLGQGGVALQAQRFGDEVWHRQHVQVSWGQRLAGIYWGAGVGYASLFAEPQRWGQAQFSAGAVAPLVPGLSLGVHAFGLGIGRVGENLWPATVQAGVRYASEEELWQLWLDMEKAVGQPFAGKVGLQYLPHDAVALRAGANTGRGTAHFGAGWQFRGMGLDYALVWHSTLGSSNILTWQWQW